MSPRQLRVGAVDLGATSGRIMSGVVGPTTLELAEHHRFPNGAVRVGGSLYWDILGIYREMLTGLRRVASTGPIDGIGIDSWAVDYGLLDRDGRLLENPYSHRDARTDGVADRALDLISPQELYAVTGLQQLPFNTIYQLIAAADAPVTQAAHTMLLLPDLLAYWLTGRIGAERTNASTTQLYDVRAGGWAHSVANKVGIPTHLLPPLVTSGDVIGRLLPDASNALGVEDLPVVAVGSHDTASAVIAVPTETDSFAYISSGTWSLVGLELQQPVLTEAAREANFTNEGGVDGTVRFLKNVMGLWLLSESIRHWQDNGVPGADLSLLLAKAAAVCPLRTVIDASDTSLLAPGAMPARIRALARRVGEPEPETPEELTRCILDSLALAYRCGIRSASTLANRAVEVVHVVGGGSQNSLLCQLTADACGMPVIAGPTEAAALGNVLVQARTLGAELTDLRSMRRLVRSTHELDRYEPRHSARAGDWVAAENRLAVQIAGRA